jgi:hypothetical protein
MLPRGAAATALRNRSGSQQQQLLLPQQEDSSSIDALSERLAALPVSVQRELATQVQSRLDRASLARQPSLQRMRAGSDASDRSEGSSSGGGGHTPQAVAFVGLTFRFFSTAYLSRFGFSLLLFAATGYINALASVLAGFRTPKITILAPDWAADKTTLPDLGHDVVSAVGRVVWGSEYMPWDGLPDKFIDGWLLATVMLIAAMPLRLLVLRRFFVVFACLNTLRSISVIITSLPDASPRCISQFGKEAGAYKDLSWRWDFREGVLSPALWYSLQRALLVLSDPAKYITCGDSVFSGHATFMSMCNAVVSQHYLCWHWEMTDPEKARGFAFNPTDDSD